MSFLGNTPTTQSFTSLTERFNGNGSATTVTLSREVYNASDIEVIVNNVQQDPYDAYTVNGTTTLTFTEAPSVGTGNIIVTYRNYTISKFIPGEGTVTTSTIASGVTLTSPVLITPNIGTPSDAVLTNATGLPIVNGTTGTLSVARGGTGASTLTANNIIIGNGTSAVQFVAPGTSGNVLTSNGTTWASQAAGGSGAQGFITQYQGPSAAPTFNSFSIALI